MRLCPRQNGWVATMGLETGQACLIVLTALAGGCVVAAKSPLDPGGVSGPQTEATVLAPACSVEGGQVVSDALRQRAISGPVRVIVRLRIALPANPDDPAYLDEIARVQNAVLAELSRQEYTLIARYKTVPLLALSGSAAVLDVLAKSTPVVCVSEDALSGPAR